MRACPRGGEKPLVEAHGPVQPSAEGVFYVGATRAVNNINNTGEMQGVIEALFWLNTCVEQGVLQVSAEMITEDTLHVKGLVEDRRLTKMKLQLHLRLVRGHTGDVGTRSLIAWQTVARDLHWNVCGGSELHLE